MNRAQWIKFIRANAARYGVDPNAALAVASQEGLSGRVGDRGTSFGPFQLHVGGALPKGRGRAWAESAAGLDYALRQMGQVAGGLTGQQAVNAIVRRFERPADPNSEVAGALAALPQYSVGQAVADSVIPSGGGMAPRAPARGKPQIVTQTDYQQQFDPGALAQSIFSSLAGGGTPDISSLVSGSYRTVPVVTQSSRPPAKTARTSSRSGGSSRSGDGGTLASKAAQGGGGYYDPATGKVIGTPFSGTHTLGNWESDRALDIALTYGSPIYAPFAGTVGSQFGALGSANPRFAGLRMHIVNPKNEWYGAHLSRFAPGIRPGVHVTPGMLIGYSGRANGVAHLHEALKYGDPYGLLR